MQSILGTAELVQRGEKSIDEMVVRECKDDSAIEAVRMFEDGGFRKLVKGAVGVSVERIKERK